MLLEVHLDVLQISGSEIKRPRGDALLHQADQVTLENGDMKIPLDLGDVSLAEDLLELALDELLLAFGRPLTTVRPRLVSLVLGLLR